MSKKKVAGVMSVVVALPLLLVVAALVRARFLPEVEVPILLYERVGNVAHDKQTVPTELFYAQIRDLAELGHKTVTPARLRAYAVWGWPLPEKPIMITFDTGSQNLITVVSPILEEQNFTAVVNLATTYIADTPAQRRNLNGEPMLTWSEVRDAMQKGVFTFGGHTRNLVDLTRDEKPFNEIRASRSDMRHATGHKSGIFSYPFGKHTDKLAKNARDAKIKFAMTYGDTVAKIGPHTNFLAIPRIRVVGGRHAFSVIAARQNTPGAPVFIEAAHTSGPAMPMTVMVFEEDGFERIATREVADFSPDAEVRIELPDDVKFPLIVDILETNRVVSYFSTRLTRNAIERVGDYVRPSSTVEINVPVNIDPL